ncbi:MAG: Nif3-like dinuclear metal center hexameric protein [Bacteroidetes bacterium]|nr:Nif3-like dinuclear metal center hexameric protein [Bacteroidota bacterium]
MIIATIIQVLEEWAPPQYQESYDNVGLLTGDKNAEVKGVLVCLDCTEEVIEEAIALGANMVIAHHPIIFSGLKKLTGANYIERTVIKAIKNDIAIYAIHTNLDNVLHGVNAKICALLEIQNKRILQVKRGIAEVGSGMIGELNTPLNTKDFLQKIKIAFSAGSVRYTSVLKDKVSRIAVCGGSGSFLLKDAIEQGADIFLSSDFKYHQFFDAENRIVIVDIGHYEAEKFTKELICEFLREKFPTFALHLSKINTNPVNYL